MEVSKKIKTLLLETGKNRPDLMGVLSMGSRQSLSNKFINERWSAEDIALIAEYCGAKLAFVLPDGKHIYIGSDDTPNSQ